MKNKIWIVIAIIIILIYTVNEGGKKEYNFLEFEMGKTFYTGGQIMFDEFVSIGNGWISEGATFTFEYPYEYRDGTYVLYPDIENDPDMQIVPGYIEDFTYSSDKPIYGAWQIRDFDDFSNKCFVGDCNKNNERNVICIENDAGITIEQFECLKWTDPSHSSAGSESTAYCNNGLFNVIGTSQLNPPWNTCFNKNTLTVNFYYVWNNNPDYEGYDPNWQPVWQNNFNELDSYINTLGIDLNANWYELELDNDTYIPAVMAHHYIALDEGQERPGDVQVIIAAGTGSPQNYGYQCPGNYPTNPCKVYSVGPRIRMLNFLDSYWRLLHEFGHPLGCPHTGAPGSLSAHLKVGDAMSYGGEASGSRKDYWYECRISTWLLGQQG